MSPNKYNLDLLDNYKGRPDLPESFNAGLPEEKLTAEIPRSQFLLSLNYPSGLETGSETFESPSSLLPPRLTLEEESFMERGSKRYFVSSPFFKTHERKLNTPVIADEQDFKDWIYEESKKYYSPVPQVAVAVYHKLKEESEIEGRPFNWRKLEFALGDTRTMLQLVNPTSVHLYDKARQFNKAGWLSPAWLAKLSPDEKQELDTFIMETASEDITSGEKIVEAPFETLKRVSDSIAGLLWEGREVLNEQRRLEGLSKVYRIPTKGLASALEGATAMLPLMLASGLGTAWEGVSVYTAAVFPDKLEEMRAKDVSDWIGIPGALALSVGEGLMERVQAKGAVNPFTKNIFAQKVIEGAKTVLWESGTEGVQKFWSDTGVEIANAIDGANPGKGLGKIFQDSFQEFTDSIGPMAVITGIGHIAAGKVHTREAVQAKKTFQDSLLTEDGAKNFSKIFPEKTMELIAKEKPSRINISTVLGFDPQWTGEQRNKFVNDLKKETLPEEDWGLEETPYPKAGIPKGMSEETKKEEIYSLEDFNIEPQELPGHKLPTVITGKPIKAEIPPYESHIVKTPIDKVEIEQKYLLISDEIYQEAKTYIKNVYDRIDKGEKTLNIGPNIDPKLLAAYVKVGAYHVEKGLRDFSKWSAKMVETFGEKIKDSLDDIWNKIKKEIPHAEETGKAIEKPSEEVAPVEEAAGGIRVRNVEKTGVEAEKEEIKSIEAVKETAAVAPEKEITPVKPEIIEKKIKGKKLTIDESKLLANTMRQRAVEARKAFKAGTEYPAALEAQKQMETKRVIEREIIKKAEGTPVNITPQKLVDNAMKHEAKGAKEGYRAAIVDRRETDKAMMEKAKKYLPSNAYKYLSKAWEKLLNQGAYTEARKNRYIEAINKITYRYNKDSAIKELFSMLEKSKAKVESGDLLPEYMEIIDDLFKSGKYVNKKDRIYGEYVFGSGQTLNISMVKPSKISIAKAQKLLKAAETVEQISKDNINNALITLENSGKTNIRELEPEQIREITNAIANAIHVSATKNRIIADKSARENAELVTSCVQEVTKNLKKEIEFSKIPEMRSPFVLLGKKIWNWVGPVFRIAYDAGVERIANENSDLYNVLVRNLKNADDNYLRSDKKAAYIYKDIVDKVGVEKFQKLSFNFTRTPELITIKLPTATSNYARYENLIITNGELLRLLHIFSDSQAKEQIISHKGPNIELERNPLLKNREIVPLKLTIHDIDAIRRAASKLVKDILETRIKHILSIQPRLRRAYKENHGHDLDWRDDYCHIERKGEEFEYLPKEPTALWSHFDKSLKNQTIFKERTGGNKTIIIGDFFKVEALVDTMTNLYLEKYREATAVMKLLTNKDFVAALRERMPDADNYLAMMKKTMQQWQSSEYAELSPPEALLAKMTQHLSTALVAGKPHIVLGQGLTLQNVLAEMNVVDIIGGVREWAKNTAEFEKTAKTEIEQWSAYLDNRVSEFSHQLVSPGVGNRTIADYYHMPKSMLDTIGQAAMEPVHIADNQVIYIIWYAAKLEGRKKGLSGDELMKYVGERARDVAQRTQATWDVLTSSELYRLARRSPLFKSLVMFSSQPLKQYAMAYRAVVKYGKSEKTVSDVMRLAKNLTIPLINNAVLYYIFRNNYWKLWGAGADDDEGMAEFITGVLEQVTFAWPDLQAVVNVSRIVHDAFEKQLYRESNTPVEQVMSNAVYSAIHIVNAVSDGINDVRYKEGADKGRKMWINETFEAIENLSFIGGAVSGLPFQGLIMHVRSQFPNRRHLKREKARKYMNILEEPPKFHKDDSEILFERKSAAWREKADKARSWLTNHGLLPKLQEKRKSNMDLLDAFK